MNKVEAGGGARPYLEDEKCAEVPPRHLPLAFGPFDFLFPKRDNSIECTQQSVLQLGAEVNPGGRIVLSGRPRKLYTSRKIFSASCVSVIRRKTSLSRFSVL